MKSSRARADFEAVKRVPISAVLERLGILSELRRVGNNLVGRCPVHRGKNRRAFTVDVNKNLWFCHGDCGRGGSTIELVAALHGIAIRDAAQEIAEWFAIQSPRCVQPPKKRRRTHVSGKPSHKVFVVEDRGEGEDNDAFWTRVGSAWPHKDGKGLNLQLASGVAVSGRVVLREYTEQDAVEDDKKTAAKKRK